MAYFAPYIDSSGLHIPTYQDMLSDMITQAKSIFGQDIYLEPDSQDYQMIAIETLKRYDTLQAVQLAYNSRGPNTAIGSALDGIVKINGISRKGATYSTCVVTLSGLPNTSIASGIIADSSGNYWNIPANIVIPATGSIQVTATAQAPGNINAAPGEINKIVTPTAGWTGVINSGKASPGDSQETDAQLRTRQVNSTAQPTKTVLEGLKGAIGSIAGVTRSRVYENDTGSTDANNLPPHSIAAVVEGGTDADIAKTLFLRKGPGCYTAGSTSVNVTDNYGQSNAIRFYRPTYVDIDVAITVKALEGYTTQTTVDIKNAIAAYLNDQYIGTSLFISFLSGTALLASLGLSQSAAAVLGGEATNISVAPSQPLFSINTIAAARHGQVLDVTDIAMAFNEVARGNTAYITVTVV